MKAFFSCLMLLTFLAAQTLTTKYGKIEVPEKVEKSFQTKYPKHTEAIWDDLGDLFLVTFYDVGELLKEATFDLDGNWKETLTSFEESEMPHIMATFIEKKYGEDVEVFEVVFLENPAESFYSVVIEVNTETEEEESESTTLIFDKNGNFLKVE